MNHTTLEVGPPRRMCWAGATLERARAVSAGKRIGGAGEWGRGAGTGRGRGAANGCDRARVPRPAPPAVRSRGEPTVWGRAGACAAAVVVFGSLGSPWDQHPFWLRRMAFLFDRVLWKAEAFAPICREEYRRSPRLCLVLKKILQYSSHQIV